MYGQVIQQSIQSAVSNQQQNEGFSAALPYPQPGPAAPYPPTGPSMPMPYPQPVTPRPNYSSNASSKVVLNLSCRGLKDLDLLSKSDPMVVVYIEVRTGDSKQWYEVGRTEVIQNNLNPDFTKSAIVEYRFEEYQKLKFEVYDCDSSSKDLKKHDFLGHTETTLGSIMGESCGKYERALTTKSGTNAGKIYVTAEEMSSCKDTVNIRFDGRKLDKKDFFGLSDPFLVFYKCNEDNSFTAVHKTEVIKNSLNPSWKEISMPVTLLCNGDYIRTIKVECYDWDSDGSHDLIGQVKLNLQELQSNPSYTAELINPKKVEKKKSYKNSGHLDLKSFKIVTIPSFLDYVQGGTELCFSVAVDFTASNGNQTLPSSLHFNNPYGPNNYVKALEAIGLICQDYDTDKMFPAFGFGAKTPPNYMISHMFPLGGAADPNCHGVAGILHAYAAAVQSVTLAGPTNFAQVINQTAMLASQEEKLNPGRRYFVLLILTDGIISDMDQTKRAIVMASFLPMSIIIVGIGPAEFDAMEELDGDDKKLSVQGKFAGRDIVQFVPFRNFSKKGNVAGDALAREVLAEVPSQLCSYMAKHSIYPAKRT